MADNDTTTGAMPGAGATPGQAGQQQPTTPPPASAMPAAGTNADPVADPSATDEGALGDAGKKVLAEARRTAKDAEARAKKAEKDLAAIRAESLTDQEKALDVARTEATSESDAKWSGIVRRTTVERALTAAGISQSELGLAAAAPEFGSLELDEQGAIEGLDKAVDSFKKGHPSLFATAVPRPAGGQGPRPSAGIDDQIRQAEQSGDVKTAIALKNRQLMQRATN